MNERKTWGTPATPEELSEFDDAEPDEIDRLFPGREGLELAELLENGDIVVLYATNSEGQASHGETVHSPGQEGYQDLWRRHKFDEPQGHKHFIAKKTVDGVWSDIGDGWLS
jgi:hypothetical protein